MKQWDYIIVGGGSTGCVLANRLSENPQNRVLLLEAGSANQSWQFVIPAAQIYTVDNPTFDWCYTTEPDSTRNNRVEKWAAGKGLGGGSAINGMLYLRGESFDFDNWANQGNKGWSYHDVLPYFRKAENFITGGSSNYGSDGPVAISPIQYKHQLSQLFIDAAKEMGIPETKDFNLDTQLGVGYYHTNQKKGRRCSTSYAYLDPIRGRKNFTIITNAFVTKLLIQDHIAVGVEYLKNNKLHQVKCNSEIVLSAGGIATPKLLMLSGIGDSNVLSKQGINVVHHLPGVGQNLQEHPAALMNFETNVPTLHQELLGYKKYLSALRWLLFRTGPLTSPVCQSAACISTDPTKKIPEIQIGFSPIGFLSVPTGLKIEQKPIVSVYIMVMRPESRGSISLASTDSLIKPKIVYPFFDNKSDLEILIKGCKIARSLFQTKTYSQYIIKEQMPGDQVTTDPHWEDYLKQYSARCFHASGTCKMGQDQLAVVDEKLRVQGIAKLRIADASIMPTIVSANITAACIMIGEKAADLILR